MAGNDMTREEYAVLVAKVDAIARDLKQVKEAVYGNGKIGLRAEVELIKQSLGLSRRHFDRELANRVDWKWVARVLLDLGVLVALLRIVIPS